MQRNVNKTHLILLSLSVLFVNACESAKRNNPDVSCAGTINYLNNCTLNGACQLSFTCGTGLKAQVPHSLRSIVNKITNLQAISSAQLNIASMTTKNTPAPLQTSVGAVPTNWFSANSPLSCMVDSAEDVVTCANFAPLADNSEIVGTLGNSNIVLSVTVDASNIVAAPTNTITACGQYGVDDNTTDHYTTVQRIYDCSKRVTDYAGVGSKGNTSVPFDRNGANNNPNANWFLVGCPDGTQKDLCAWLAPQVESGNSTIEINCNGSNCDPTSPNIAVGTRMVWSGVLTNGTFDHDFAATNGTNNASTVRVNCDGDGQCALYQNSSPTATFQSMIPTADFSFTADQTNLCTQQFSAKDPSFSGMFSASLYNWIVPSYPMMLTVSGASGCNSASPACIPEGFSAFSSPIPSFQTSLWSSSLVSDGFGWFFQGGSVDDDPHNRLDGQFGARCASLAW